MAAPTGLSPALGLGLALALALATTATAPAAAAEATDAAAAEATVAAAGNAAAADMPVADTPVADTPVASGLAPFHAPGTAPAAPHRATGQPVPWQADGPTGAACVGVAVLSHGAGGTERDLAYLAAALAGDGWLAVRVGHAESGPLALRQQRRGDGLEAALLRLTTDPAAHRARFDDLGAALDWAHPRCAATRTAVIGHSMGAATVMLEAGAANRLGLAARQRFDAHVALSPQGPGPIFPPDAWRALSRPVLSITGTRDEALGGDWTTRTQAFDAMPPGCKALVVIDGATHLNFAGIGLSRATERATVAAVLDFLRSSAAPGARCTAGPAGPGVSVRLK